mgnify:CR=1 FL=1
MDQAARVAFIHAQTVCAMAKIEGMKAENLARLAAGNSLAYRERDFLAVPDQYLIGHNAVIEYLRGD